MGKVNVTLVNSHAFCNAFHGLHLGVTLYGSVTVNNCTFPNNHGVMDVVKMCGQECPVTIDGVRMPLDFDLGTFGREMEDMARWKAVDCETIGEVRVSLLSRRAMIIAHGGEGADMRCLNCDNLNR